ncbi:MAG TPA: GNAT family N-acetyltransferase [Solirubrobacterales bacterium]|nr:GNAT family N-acetyltransferase [Solirubrobacterales bacterium]
MSVTVRRARDDAELEAAMDLRIKVFVGEQGVDEEEERDDLDDESLQIVALDESGVIATCRLRELGEDTWKLERMVVERRLRKLGVGGRLLAGAEDEARAEGGREMVLHAQRRAEAFYASHGYVPEGEPFLEAGIEHVAMRKELDG